MYRCHQCQEVVGPRIPQARVVVATRTRTYPRRPEVNRVRRAGKKVVWVDDPGGVGTEIIREVALCPGCRASLQLTS